MKKKSYTSFAGLTGSAKTCLAASLSVAMFLAGCQKKADETSSGSATSKDGAASTSATGPDFTLVVLPDTQYYVTDGNNSNGNHFLEYFKAQTQWISDNRVSQNIPYVVHVGDIVHSADKWPNQWKFADSAMRKLDEIGIPYGTAVGNHEQGTNTEPNEADRPSNTTIYYNQYYGLAKFQTKPWYGGYYDSNLGTNGGNNNDTHWDKFTAGGVDWMVVYVEHDDVYMEDATNMNNWVYNTIAANPTKKAIVVSHYIIRHDDATTDPNQFGTQGAAIYAKVKSLPNVVMFLSGHIYNTTTLNGEGYRQDTYNGKTIKAYEADFQQRPNGGDGYMRLMKISTINDRVDVKTYSPKKLAYETDANSQFSRALFRDPTAMRTHDFNNTGKSRLTFYNAGVWKVNGLANFTYGNSTSIAVPADYDGNGSADWAYWDTADGYNWNLYFTPNFRAGASGDIPVPGDYNGDGKADICFFRPSNMKWFVYPDETTGVTYGKVGEIPVPADYDGDGKVNFATWGKTDFIWYLDNMPNVTWGTTGDVPVPGDYNGDGKVDCAIYRPSTGQWYIKGQTTLSSIANQIPCPGDYFGVGKTQPAVYNATTKVFTYYNNGVASSFTAATVTGDKLVNLPYHIKKYFYPNN